MKIIAVGDIHGRETWKQVLEKEKDFDKFVFVGDYFDAFPPMTVDRIMQTFQEILEFKEQNEDRVHLLMGNHDFQYTPLSGGTERYSGYNPITQSHLDAMIGWWSVLEPAFQYEDVLFSHAGLTNTFAAHWGMPKFAAANAAYEITKLFDEHPEAFKFFDGDTSRCGEHVKQSPFWVRPDTLETDMYPGLRMVVGHTHAEGVEQRGPLFMIDTGKQGEYLRIEDGNIFTGTL